ncbi:hypothetical protein PYCCODRAFT_9834 [Trametes coccinea BRFM310]|uniref:Uncharacterized protein n=1 Tax=Trametes coccinea (strain BRFM310) TaxID=1353009 RepID=A0A1Y2J4H0_TRAC3|nr:hypothetical protein PYCCODRAFT_9834 [Trametes coccinea BRFM310]
MDSVCRCRLRYRSFAAVPTVSNARCFFWMSDSPYARIVHCLALCCLDLTVCLCASTLVYNSILPRLTDVLQLWVTYLTQLCYGLTEMSREHAIAK